MTKKILITGVAGFIGFHLAKRLILKGDCDIVGIDNINDYYDVKLKEDRLAQLKPSDSFKFIKLDLLDREGVANLFKQYQFDYVINLAAQAGVRDSLTKPYIYADTNLVGFVNVLENCRQSNIKHFIYASSSSVYGTSQSAPFTVKKPVDHPVSLYGATKKANELMAHAYSHLYKLATTGLRFFTVYGPWGRPDMAYFSFTKAILEGETIKVFNDGKMKRDFTYIDDIVEGVVCVMDKHPKKEAEELMESPCMGSADTPYKIYNIGNTKPIELTKFISMLEKAIGNDAKKEYLPGQPGDMLETCADIEGLEKEIGFRPKVAIEEGLQKFVDWYRDYYKK